MTDREPLWKVMRDAYLDSFAIHSSEFYAAEIRAIADAIPDQFYGAGGIRRWLLAEADRAENGS